jgi:hypothetical protein
MISGRPPRDPRKLLTLERRPDGWWVKSSVPGVDDLGPYDTRGEATEDREGVLRFVLKNVRLEPQLTLPMGGESNGD